MVKKITESTNHVALCLLRLLHFLVRGCRLFTQCYAIFLAFKMLLICLYFLLLFFFFLVKSMQSDMHCVQKHGSAVMQEVNCTEALSMATWSGSAGVIKTRTVSFLVLLRVQPATPPTQGQNSNSRSTSSSTHSIFALL